MVIVHIPISVDQECFYGPNSTLNVFLMFSYNNTVHNSDVILATASYSCACMCDIATLLVHLLFH